MLVQVQQFVRVGAGSGPPDRLESEQGRDLTEAEDLLVSVGPAHPHQPVAESLRQVPLSPKVLDGDRFASFRELLALLSHDQGNVGEGRRRDVQGPVDRQLKGSVAVVVGAADHVADPHVDIVHHHRQVI